MDTIAIAGGVCIAGALVVAVLTSRDKPSEMPCTFCGAILTPPEYRCKHHLGDGRVRV